MKNLFIEKLKSYFDKNSITLSEIQCEQFYKYYCLLIDWNNKINLTAITKDDDVIVKHFFDSVVCKDIFIPNSKIIDIGAGAGFPSLPIKILRPDLEIVLVDSVNKKVNFLSSLISELGFEKVYAIHSRAEDLANKNEYREKFDYCVSRAVAKLNTLCEYCLPFIKVGGKMLAYKSVECEEEIKNINKGMEILGGKIEKVLDYRVEDYCRKIIEINKFRTTPSKYPRSGNKPRLTPLN